MGRKTSPDPRQHRLTLRFTASELLTARKQAARAGMTLSDYGRAAMARGYRRHTPQAKASAAAPLIEHGLEIALVRIGTNLNQIAHRLNAQDFPAPPELGPLLGQIRELVAQVRPGDRRSTKR